MTVFVDTSALLAILDADDANHARAARHWRELVTRDEAMVTSNYVLLEAFALVQNRLGMQAVVALQRDILPILDVEWIDRSAHANGLAAMTGAGRRKLTLVDCTSFEIMRSMGLGAAFAFDRHFREQGFVLQP